MASKKNDTKIDVHRSSETGRFVTEGYARKHPKTTEHERIKRDSDSKK